MAKLQLDHFISQFSAVFELTKEDNVNVRSMTDLNNDKHKIQ